MRISHRKAFEILLSTLKYVDLPYSTILTYTNINDPLYTLVEFFIYLVFIKCDFYQKFNDQCLFSMVQSNILDD